MYIDIELDDFIDLIKNPHTVQETAEVVAKYLDTDDLDGEIDINYNNYDILSQALLKNNSISYIIDNFSDDNSELVINCIFEYLISNNTENIDDDALYKVICLLQNEGYITKSGLSGKKSYERSYKDIDFNDLYHCSYFIWSEQDFKCESEYGDVIEQLVLTYLKGFDNIQYCAYTEEWISDPYDYIKDQYFDNPRGAKGADVLANLFNNFNKLKADYIRYFGEIMPINNSTTVDEFIELCDNCDDSEFSDAYYNLINDTDFFDAAGITAMYFG